MHIYMCIKVVFFSHCCHKLFLMLELTSPGHYIVIFPKVRKRHKSMTPITISGRKRG